MKLYLRTLLAVTCSIIFFSCTDDVKVTDPLSDFSSITPTYLSVTNCIDLESYEIYKPGNIVKYDDKYIVQDKYDDYLVKAIELNASTIYNGFHRGNGPDEFTSIGSLQVFDSEPFVYDIAKKQLHKLFFRDSVIISEVVCSILSEDRPFLVLNTGNGIVGSGVFQKDWIRFYTPKGMLVSALDFPEFSTLDNLTPADNSIIYMSTLMTTKPDGSRITCATQKAGVLSIVECLKDSLVEIVQKKYFPADVVKAPNGQVVYRKEGKVGFCDISCSNDLIYVLYSGKTREASGSTAYHCQHILVYDWDGNPVKHFVLEKELLSAKYDSERNLIYGIGYAPEGCIFEYDLNK